VRQLDIPWAKKAVPVSKTKTLIFLVNIRCSTFRWREASVEDAIDRAQKQAAEDKSTTTLYEEVDGKCGPRVAAFDQNGKRFL